MPRHPCKIAAKSGSLDLLKYFISIGFPLSRNVFSCALEGSGDLTMIEYLHQNSCPFHTWICTTAAENRRLDLLKYLIENEYPWDFETLDVSVSGGSFDIVEFLLEIAPQRLDRYDANKRAWILMKLEARKKKSS